MTLGHYILDKDGQTPKAVSLLEWAEWFEHDKRVVRKTNVKGVEVSTVFLGIDHSFSNRPDAKPVLWETMVFGGELDQEQDRYDSYASAIEGHEAMVARVETGGPKGRER